jgi:hypothetical protein
MPFVLAVISVFFISVIPLRRSPATNRYRNNAVIFFNAFIYAAFPASGASGERGHNPFSGLMDWLDHCSHVLVLSVLLDSEKCATVFLCFFSDLDIAATVCVFLVPLLFTTALFPLHKYPKLI